MPRKEGSFRAAVIGCGSRAPARIEAPRHIDGSPSRQFGPGYLVFLRRPQAALCVGRPFYKQRSRNGNTDGKQRSGAAARRFYGRESGGNRRGFTSRRPALPARESPTLGSGRARGCPYFPGVARTRRTSNVQACCPRVHKINSLVCPWPQRGSQRPRMSRAGSVASWAKRSSSFSVAAAKT